MLSFFRTSVLRQLVGLSGSASPVAAGGADSSMLEQLEARSLLTATIVNPVPDQAISSGAGNSIVQLTGRYRYGSATPTVVRFQTTDGTIEMLLRSDWASNTVANFLTYVNQGFYENIIFHRTEVAGSDFPLLQTGGFTLPTVTRNAGDAITDDNWPRLRPALASPIGLEHAFGNNRWTVGMARTSERNSATSQFYFNLFDNQDSFDGEGTPTNPGFNTFGIVMPTGRDALTTIHGLTRTNLDGQTFNGVPLRTPPGIPPVRPSQYAALLSASVVPANQVNAASIDPITFFDEAPTVTVQDSTLLTASIQNGNLVLTPNQDGRVGNTTVRIRIADFDGTVIEDTFTIAVGLTAGVQTPTNVVQGASFRVNAHFLLPPTIPAGITRVEFFRDDGDGVFDSQDVSILNDTDALNGFRNIVSSAGFNTGSVRIFARCFADNQLITTAQRDINVVANPGAVAVTPTTTAAGSNTTVTFTPTGQNPTTPARISIFSDNNNSGTYNNGDRQIGFATFADGQWRFNISGSLLPAGANSFFFRVLDTAGNWSTTQAFTITAAV
jgi:cyclophilin family peptidyl-prolyl cis-trans isomerase